MKFPFQTVDGSESELSSIRLCKGFAEIILESNFPRHRYCIPSRFLSKVGAISSIAVKIERERDCISSNSLNLEREKRE